MNCFMNKKKNILLVIIIVFNLLLYGCGKDEKQYENAITKINEYYTMYNNYSPIGENIKIDEAEYGKYTKLVTIERNYLSSEQKIEVDLADKIEEIMYFKMNNYDNEEVEKFENSVSELKTALNSKIESSEPNKEKYLKDLNALEMEKDKKELYLESTNNRIKIENEYLDKYNKLLKELVEKMEERSEIYAIVSKNKKDTKYDLKKEFDKLTKNDEKQQDITNKIIQETETYDKKVASITKKNIETK